jgi:hypothetical protein
MGYMSAAIYPEPLRSLDSATLSGSYLPLGTPLINPIRIVKFTNNSNVAVTISWDGVTDHEFLPAGSFLLLDISSNKEAMRPFDISAHTQFSIKGAAGVGLIYVSAYFGL